MECLQKKSFKMKFICFSIDSKIIKIPIYTVVCNCSTIVIGKCIPDKKNSTIIISSAQMYFINTMDVRNQT